MKNISFNEQFKNSPERLYPENSAKRVYTKIETIAQPDRKCDLAKFVFHPESPPRLSWDILTLLIIIYQAVTVPYYICFNDEYSQELIILDLAMNLLFLLDIFISFNTGFYMKGSLIMRRRTIAFNYVKLWFWIDLAATFPFNWAVEGINFTPDNTDSSSKSLNKTSKIIKLIKIFRFLRILRLLRIAKLKRILIKIEDYIANNTLANLFVFIRILSLVFFIAHWTACFWFFIGTQETLGHSVTWITNANIQTASPYEQYITSLYWAFTTIATVGYGDITPITVNEKLFTMFAMIMSSGIFAYTVGSIGSLISKQTALENSYREQVVSVNSYMKKKFLPKSLQFRVRRYLDYILEVKKKKKLDEKQVLSLLSEPLRDEIYSHINANVLKLCKVFDEYEAYFIAQVTRTLENETYAPGDTIFEEREISSKIYFILNGKIEIYHQSTLSLFSTLESRQFFGEIAFFTGTARCASARCIEFVDLLSLIRINFLSLLEKFPEAQEFTKLLQKKCEDGDYSCLSISCYLCEELGHVAAKCKSILINLDQEETRNQWLLKKDTIKSVNPKLIINFPIFSRRIRKNYKARIDKRHVIGIPRRTFQLFPEESNLYPAIKFASEKYAQDDSGTSTRATNKDTFVLKYKDKKKYKYPMFHIKSDAGEDLSSIQDNERISDFQPFNSNESLI